MLRDLFSLFPAYAGVIRGIPDKTVIEKTFPRIRGGDPGLSALHAVLQDFSPHTRG